LLPELDKKSTSGLITWQITFLENQTKNQPAAAWNNGADFLEQRTKEGSA
jgi:hypothetical protein